MQEAEGRLEQVMADLAKGSENTTPDLAKVQELEEILKGIYNEGSGRDHTRTMGQGSGGEKAPTQEEPHPGEGKDETPKAAREEGGHTSVTEESPPQTRLRTTEDEDQPLLPPETIAIDEKILMMLVKTVKDLKEGVKKGLETRASSSVYTKSSSHSEDEEMQADEDLS